MNPRSQDPNAGQLLAAVQKLGPLLDQIVFVGGCATGLLITDPGAAPVRPTLDVDAIVAVTSYAEFMALEDILRQLGFQQLPGEGVPICRWTNQDVVFDLMPADPSILGFTNRWYVPSVDNAREVTFSDHKIRLITAPYFLATKLEAFHGRGRNDYRMSRDLEDIVTVIDGRPEIVIEVGQTDPAVQRYLSEEFSALLANREFIEALPGHLLPDAASQQRIRIIVGRIQQMALER